MKKTLSLFSVIIAFAFASCNQQAKETSTGETVTITHSLGTTEVPLNPQRVVVLHFGALENLDAIDVKPVALTKTGLPKYLAKYNDESIVDVGNLMEIDLEKINEAKPDLIIIGSRLKDSYDALSKIAPTIHAETDYNDVMGSLKKNLSDLGKIFGKETELNKAYADIEAKAEGVRNKAAQSNDKALVILHNKGKFSAYGSKSRFGIVHDVLGVKEAIEGLDTHIHGNSASNEFIQQTNPDILFVVDRSSAIGDNPLKKEDVENKLIQQTNAYKNNKIIYLNSEAWYLSGGGIASTNIMIDEIGTAF